MKKRAPRTNPRPLDDRPIWNVLFGLWGYPAVLVAHELKFFELFADKPLTLDAICAAASRRSTGHDSPLSCADRKAAARALGAKPARLGAFGDPALQSRTGGKPAGTRAANTLRHIADRFGRLPAAFLD